MSAEKRRWIWLRGLVRWKVHWGDFLEEFKKVFPDDEIEMLDLPGFGDFYQEDCPTTMDEIVLHLDKRVDWKKGPYHVLAFSLGAMVAAKWAQKRPQDFKKIFLVNTSDNRSPFYRRFRLQNIPFVVSRAIYNDAYFVESGILKVISNQAKTRARYEDKFTEAFLQTPFSRKNFITQMRVAAKTRFPAHPPVPAVFMNSTADRLVDYRCSVKIAQEWGSPVFTHKQAGHDLTLDDPQWVLKNIQTQI